MFNKDSLTIRDAVISDAVVVGSRLRADDRRELEATGHYDPVVILDYSVRVSTVAMAACHNGVPMALFGIHGDNPLSSRASVWFLGTGELDLYPFEMVKISRRFLRKVITQYDVLYNHTDSRYHRAIRWLKLLGFVFYPERDVRFGDIRFNYFELKKGDL